MSKPWRHRWSSFGLELPYHFGRDDNRWLKVVEKATGREVFLVPLFLGWRAEGIAAKKCQELNKLGEPDASVLDEIDQTA